MTDINIAEKFVSFKIDDKHYLVRMAKTPIGPIYVAGFENRYRTGLVQPTRFWYSREALLRYLTETRAKFEGQRYNKHA
jgi:hypothetical protein